MSVTLPQLGDTLEVRAFVSLGDLSPDDVDVQVVHGRVRHEDDLVETTVDSLDHAETYEGGRHRFEGRVALADRPGRSATPSGCCRRTRTLPRPPSSAGSALPTTLTARP